MSAIRGMPFGPARGGSDVNVDLLFAAVPLSLLDVLLLPLGLLLVVPGPAALLAGLLHGLELVLHVSFAKLGHVAPLHWLSGFEEFL